MGKGEVDHSINTEKHGYSFQDVNKKRRDNIPPPLLFIFE
jgi:hypothetical protein